jgi:hypothetical protein
LATLYAINNYQNKEFIFALPILSQQRSLFNKMIEYPLM